MVINIPDQGNQNELVFLLGAGASIEAGVPDTRRFIYGEKENDGIQGFLEWLKETDKQKELEILGKILNTFERKNESPIIDVELVLGVLNALNNKEKYDLVYFYDQNAFEFKSEGDIQTLRTLETDLKKFIRKKVVVNKDGISYLAPLMGFQKPINIFSVNYDTCVEMLSIKHKLTYTDGFGLYWDPELFGKDFDIKLFKLHGSIIWYRTDWGNYVKLPVEFGESDRITLIGGETASPFILYPMGKKWEYAEPLGYLTTKLQKCLKVAKVYIVVGYSFRDDYIRNIFFEAAKENKKLTIVLISPNAGEVFKEKLRFIDEEKVSSSPISEMVICFNYPFSSVLRDNYLYRCCKRNIPQIRNLYSAAENARREGFGEEYENEFKQCIDHAIRIGDVITVEKIFEKELGISPPDHWGTFDEKEQFRLSYSLAIFHLLNDDEKRKNYFDILINTLRDVLSAGIEYFDLNVELSKEKEKEDNNERIKEIEEEIKNLQNNHPYSSFYYWTARNTDLRNAFSPFANFIQLQIKLRSREDNITKLLEDTLNACQDFLNTSNIQYDAGKYKNAEKVDIGGTKVEIHRKMDLEKDLGNLIKSIYKFMELYE